MSEFHENATSCGVEAAVAASSGPAPHQGQLHAQTGIDLDTGERITSVSKVKEDIANGKFGTTITATGVNGQQINVTTSFNGHANGANPQNDMSTTILQRNPQNGQFEAVTHRHKSDAHDMTKEPNQQTAHALREGHEQTVGRMKNCMNNGGLSQ